MREGLINFAYLIASVCFILTFKGLAHPRTAVRANKIGALGMLIAVVATLTASGIGDWRLITVGLVIGTVIGAILATKFQMTGMPQMVAALNGFGGGASVLVAGEALSANDQFSAQVLVATALSGLIGAVTFWGSFVAYAKLQEVLIPGKPVIFAGQKALNALLLLASLVAGGFLVASPDSHFLYWSIVLAASLLGVLTTIAIGGADMPVVVCLLNSYSGLAACTTGFVLDNYMLIIAGSLVGASGLILSQIMCKAMNRPLTNVLFGGLGAEIASGAEADSVYAGKIKSVSAEEIGMLLESARRVVIVPGYGLAVSQAQHAVRDLTRLLESRGVNVLFGIHPVAGRMPGHMNVLLAEADISYEKVIEMDAINPLFPQTDVAIVIGANDVVNPLARTDPSSPIAGMPILDVDLAQTVIVIKRSLSPGFAGIPNPLFVADNSLMFFADGRLALQEIINAVKAPT